MSVVRGCCVFTLFLVAFIRPTDSQNPPPPTTAISPRIGPRVGGTLLTALFDETFRVNQTGEYFCHFTNQRVRATYDNSAFESRIICYSPPNDLPVTVSVGISEGSQGQVASRFNFHYYAIWDLVPLGGPLQDGTTVVVKLLNVLRGTQPLCKFGTSAVPATHTAENFLKCEKPVVKEPGEVFLEVSLDGVLFTNDERIFTFYERPRLTMLSLSLGPMTGNTHVLGFGSSFLDLPELTCRFGETLGQAVYYNSSTILCISPPSLTADTVKVAVSLNSQDFTATDLNFKYYSAPVFIRIAPSMGPRLGGTKVVIVARDPLPFPAATDIYCRFGGIVQWQRAVVKNLTAVECVTPPVPNPREGGDIVDFSWSGQQYGASDLKFYFFAITGILPHLGPDEGGTTVHVSGPNLGFSNSYKCWFGGNAVPGTYIKETGTLDCPAPDWPMVDTVSFEVSLNGNEQSADGFTFQFVHPTFVNGVSPKSGPTNGGFYVAVDVTDLANTSLVACQFSSELHGELYSPHVIFKNDSTVLCLVPQTKFPGRVNLAISANNQQFSRTPVSFSYYLMTTFDPTAGPISGSTSVSIEVELERRDVAPNLLRCRFGKDVVDATFVSVLAGTTNETKNSLSCRSPPQLGPGLVTLGVSLNSRDFSESPKKFFYYDLPEVTEILPNSGPFFTDTPITVNGNNFTQITGLDVQCAFDSSVQTAIFISSTSLQCKARAKNPFFDASSLAPVAVEVSLNKQQFTFNQHKFVYYELTHAFPLFGPKFGHTTTVKVRGYSFRASATSKCKFGESYESFADYLAEENALVCTAPPFDTLLELTFEITLNGYGYTQSGKLFKFYDQPVPSSVVPFYSPSVGGQLIHVNGTFFSRISLDQELMCRFGNTPVVADFYSDSYLTCVAPFHVASIVKFGISLNNQSFEIWEGNFIFYSITNVIPSAGLIEGKTSVTIYGLNFLDHTGITKCRFGSSVVDGVLSNDLRTIVCISPVFASEFRDVNSRTVRLDVSFDNRVYSSDGFTYFYDSLPTMASIVPNQGSILGGTNVTVLGLNFRDSDQARCSYGGIMLSPFKFLDNKQVLCTIPSLKDLALPGGQSVMQLRIGVNTQQFVPNSLTFTYLPIPTITSIVPNVSPAGVSVTVKIDGANFVQKMICKFGDDISPQEAIKFPRLDRIQCEASQSSPRPIKVPVYLSLDAGQTFHRSDVLFSFFGIFSVFPYRGPRFVATNLTLDGDNFLETASYQCVFSNGPSVFAVEAVFISVKAVYCLTPETLSLGVWSLEASNGQEATRSGFEFLVYEQPSIASVFPDFGPSTGGIDITVQGDLFKSTPLLRCRFGEATTDQVTFVHERMIVCHLPPITIPGIKTIEVSLNAQVFTKDRIRFTYLGVPEVRSLLPVSGPVVGNTEVTVFGINFENRTQLSCYWDVQLSPNPLNTTQLRLEGTFWKSTYVTCKSPPSVYNQLEIALRLTMDLEHFSNPYKFYYYEVRELRPPSGPTKGDTIIEVVGPHLNNGTDYMCKFGAAQTPGTFDYDSRSVLCKGGPMLNLQRTVDVEVALTGITTFSRSGLFFTFYDSPVVVSVTPDLGPDSGGTTVTVAGGNFKNLPRLRCRFGGGATEVVLAKFVDTSEVVCVSPAISMARTVSVDITLNNQQYTNDSVVFHYYGITSISPSGGPFSGRTEVVVSGINFHRSNQHFCRYGRVFPENSRYHAADNTIICPSPPVSDPTTQLSISLNGVTEFTETTFEFVYYKYGSLIVQPRGSPSQGGEKIYFRGVGFVAYGAIRCRFQSNQIESVTNGTLENSTHIHCFAPEQPAGPLAVAEVTFNGAQYTTDATTFYYYAMTGISPDRGPASGNTKVRLNGVNFFMAAMKGRVRCRFGNSTSVPGVVVGDMASSRVECTIPPLTDVLSEAEITSRFAASHLLSVRVAVTLNLGLYTNDTVYYSYYRDPVVLSASPLSLSSFGTAVVSIAGVNFLPFDTGATCRFGETSVPATRAGLDMMSCLASPFSISGFLSLGLSWNGQQYALAPEKLFVYEVHSSTPVGGPSEGNTVLTVRGVFRANTTTYCRFTFIGEYVGTLNAAANTVTCVSPPALPQNVSVTIRQNNQPVDHSRELYFQYYQKPTLTSCSPVGGPFSGGTMVYVNGTGFLTSLSQSCRFLNQIVVPATYISSTEIKCLSPAFVPPNLLWTIDVSLNNVEFSSNPDVLFRYYDDPILEQVVPTSGPRDGTGKVIVSGKRLFGGVKYTCKFDSIVVPAVFMEVESHVVCTPPVKFPRIGTYQLYVSLNDQQFVKAPGSFLIYENIRLQNIFPTGAQRLLNTEITMVGYNFQNLPGLSCKFGELIQPGYWLNNTNWFMCLAPFDSNLPNLASRRKLSSLGTADDDEHSRDVRTLRRNEENAKGAANYKALAVDESVRVHVSLNGHDWTPESLLFTYYDVETSFDCPRGCSGHGSCIEAQCRCNTAWTGRDCTIGWAVLELRPLVGRAVGGTQITVKGFRLNVADLPLTCFFGGEPRRGFQIPGGVSCASEGLDNLQGRFGNLPGTEQVSLEIGYDRLVPSTDNHKFTYFHNLNIFSREPSYGPSKGGTTVTLFGVGFPYTMDVRCKFHDNYSPFAEYIDDTSVKCVLPPGPAREIDLQLSLDGQNYFATSVPFLYFLSPEINLLQPSLATVDGGTTVTIFGTGFQDSSFVRCKFGSIIVAATVKNFTQMSCDVPPAPGGVPLNTTLEVSMNGDQYTSEHRDFRYIPMWTVNGTISPPLGPELGGTLITVYGSGFVPSLDLYCGINQPNGWRIPATYISPVAITCITPEVQVSINTSSADLLVFDVFLCQYIQVDASTERRLCTLLYRDEEGLFDAINRPRFETVRLDVSLDGQVWTKGVVAIGDAVRYIFTEEVQVKVLRPNMAPLKGGTVVTVTGDKYQNKSSISCFFDNERVPAVFLAWTSVSCVAPPQTKTGTVQVRVSLNGIDRSIDFAEFYVVDLWHITSVDPDQAPTLGGTMVTLRGPHFLHGTLLRCKFGDVFGLETVYFNETSVGCRTPSWYGFETVRVSLSLDGDHYSEDKVMFTFDAVSNLAVFGGNFYGHLGLGHRDNQLLPIYVSGILSQNVTAVATGTEHTMVLAASTGIPIDLEDPGGTRKPYITGRLFSWGDNLFGQLGLGPNIRQQYEPTLVEALVDHNVVAIATGAYSSFAVTDQGLLFAWGWNSHNQLGFGRFGALTVETPAVVEFFKLNEIFITAVASGFYHTLALTSTNKVYSWGLNTHGQLGLSDYRDRTLPALIRKLEALTIAEVHCGFFHSAAVTAERTLMIWGSNSKGQLGLDQPALVLEEEFTTPSPTAVPVPPVVSVSLGSYHTVMTAVNGWELYVWGRNNFGQLGLGDYGITERYYRIAPYRMALPKKTRVTAVAAGMSHTLAVFEGEEPLGYHGDNLIVQRLYSWGSSQQGQLGHGDTVMRTTPTRILASNATSFYIPSVGSDHSTVVTGCPYFFGVMCAGHGVCTSQAECICDSGWRGPFCHFECDGGADNICSGNGECLPDASCVCRSGFNAMDCSIECIGGAENPCSGHGICQSDGSCVCDIGYRSHNCTLACPGRLERPDGPPLSCTGHGSCDGNAVCSCDFGFRGKNCDIECLGGHRTPCNFNGVCLENGTCECKDYFRNDSCSIECLGGASNPCSFHGECLHNGTCDCHPKYRGYFCQFECPGDHPTQVCAGHGICVLPNSIFDEMGLCLCEDGWMSKNCSFECLPSFDNPCNKRGMCVDDGSCECFDGYRGLTCELECAPFFDNPCHGHGFCDFDASCLCMPGFRTSDCAVECRGGADNECSGRGICDEVGACTCNTGYEADDCSQLAVWLLVLVVGGVVGLIGTVALIVHTVRRVRANTRRRKRRERRMKGGGGVSSAPRAPPRASTKGGPAKEKSSKEKAGAKKKGLPPVKAHRTSNADLV